MKLTDYAKANPLLETIDRLCEGHLHQTQKATADVKSALELLPGINLDLVADLAASPIEPTPPSPEFGADYLEGLSQSLYMAHAFARSPQRPELWDGERAIVLEEPRRTARRFVNDLVRVGTDLVGAEQQFTDTSTPDGRLAQLLVLVAQAHATSTSKRSKAEPTWRRVITGRGDIGAPLNGMLASMPPIDEKARAKARNQLVLSLGERLDAREDASVDYKQLNTWVDAFIRHGAARLTELRTGRRTVSGGPPHPS